MPGDGGYWGEFSPGDIPLSRPSEQVVVFRVKDDNEHNPDDFDLEYLPNIYCTAITVREGAHPPTASFRYSFDPNFLPEGLPTRFHQVYGTVTPGEGIVEIDDRLLVVRILGGSDDTGDGSQDQIDFMYIFDGYVTNPQVSVDGSQENVTIDAVAAPVREWDFVLPGAVWSTENPKDSDDKSIFGTEVPARFNPNGKPNACADSMVWTGQFYFTDEDKSLFRAFVTPHHDDKYFIWSGTSLKNTDIKQWTLGSAAKYIVAVGIEWPMGMGGEALVAKPSIVVHDIDQWEQLFQAIVPTKDGEPVDLTDPSTFKYQDIVCPDVEVTGEAWPNALEKLIKPFGFLFRFDLRTTDDGKPEWSLTPYRSDDDRLRTELMLQPVDDVILDPARSNVGAIQIQRDAIHVANEFEVDTQLVMYEATFVLAPGFPIDPGDTTDMEQWRGEHKDPKKRDYYRKFVFGEGNSQWWHADQKKMLQTQFDGNILDDLFDTILTTEQAKKRPPYAKRNRRPYGHLNTPDPAGRPYIWKLAVSTTSFPGDTTVPKYKGQAARLWDGTGKWKPVPTTQCSLLEDEIGVRVTCETPGQWNTGAPKDGDEDIIPTTEGAYNLVDLLANPDPATPRPILALTCVIFGDKDLDAMARIRQASITKFQVRRKIDARDRWKRQLVTWYSMTALQVHDITEFGDGGYIDIRDDTKDAKDAAIMMQRVHELGSHSGTVTIKRLSTAYNVGQTVTGIIGREVDFTLNSSAPDGETPLFPKIATITLNLDNQQTTTLTLTDEKAQPMTRHRALQLRPNTHGHN